MGLAVIDNTAYIDYRAVEMIQICDALASRGVAENHAWRDACPVV